MFILHGIYAAKVSLLEHFFIGPYRVSEVLVFFAKMNFTIHLCFNMLLCVQEFSEQCFFAFISLCSD